MHVDYFLLVFVHQPVVGPRQQGVLELPHVILSLGESAPGHYGLTGGWVPKFKASYLAYFLQCALTDYASGKA